MTSKAELIEKIAAETGMSKRAAAAALEVVVQTMTVDLKKEGRFSLSGFGTFKVRARKARTARNPQTGATIKVKASKAVGFKAAPTLKEAVARTKV